MQINYKSKPIQILLNVLFFISGIFFLYLAFRNQNWNEILDAIENAKLWIVFPIFLINFLGASLRTVRWQILIKPIEGNVKFVNAFSSLMFGYLVNYAVPRLGELVRCISLTKKEKKSTPVLFGTVMAERMADLVLLLLTLLVTFFANYDTVSTFFGDNIFGPIFNLVKEKLFKNEKMTAITLIGAGILIYLLYSFLKKSTKEKASEDKLDKMVDDTWTGLMAIAKVENKLVFVLLSLGIWGCYFLTSYLWLFAFDATSNFGIGVGITIFAISTIARSVPIQGGAMGAYHYLVTQGLLLFGVSSVVGNAYAILNHGSSTVFQLIVGVISSVLLSVLPDVKEEKLPETNI